MKTHDPEIVVLSAQGTGTNFVLQFLDFGQVRGVFDTHARRGCLGGVHCDKAIIPLRHPFKSYRSMIRTAVAHDVIIEQWRCLIDYVPRFKQVFYVPVDIKRKRRRKLIERLAMFAGVEDRELIDRYVKEWPKVNAWPEKQPELEHIAELDFAVEWFDGINRQYRK